MDVRRRRGEAPHDSLLTFSLSHSVPASLQVKMSQSPAATEDQTFADLFEFYIEGVLLLAVAVMGIIGNLFFIIVFSSRKKKINTFHGLMVSLAYFDSLYIACSVFVFAMPLIYPACATTSIFTNAITILLPLAHVGLNGES